MLNDRHAEKITWRMKLHSEYAFYTEKTTWGINLLSNYAFHTE